MRKLLATAFVLLMALTAVQGALAEDSSVQITEKTVGEGATTISVFVQLASTEDQATLYSVKTDETTLLAALQKAELVAGEEVSWGFNVTTVAGVKADYDGKGEYWNILAYDETEGFLPLETAIAATPITADSIFLFYLNQ